MEQSGPEGIDPKLQERMTSATEGAYRHLYRSGACDENQVFMVMAKVNKHGNTEIHARMPDGEVINVNLVEAIITFVEEIVQGVHDASEPPPNRAARRSRRRRPE